MSAAFKRGLSGPVLAPASVSAAVAAAAASAGLSHPRRRLRSPSQFATIGTKKEAVASEWNHKELPQVMTVGPCA